MCSFSVVFEVALNVVRYWVYLKMVEAELGGGCSEQGGGQKWMNAHVCVWGGGVGNGNCFVVRVEFGRSLGALLEKFTLRLKINETGTWICC
jgi:hypothetical protein